MDIRKSKSISVATVEVGSAEASTSTTGEVVDCATQADVSMKDKGTSCKVIILLPAQLSDHLLVLEYHCGIPFGVFCSCSGEEIQVERNDDL